MPGYIKIDRKILEWKWYKNEHTKTVFFHCLLKANWKDGTFEEKNVPIGSFISSIQKLSDELSLTQREIRTAIKHLKMTGEMTVTPYSKYSVFTINNYSKYQLCDKQNDKQVTGKRQASDRQATSKCQTDDKQVTTIEEYKESKEIKEGKKVKREEDNINTFCSEPEKSDSEPQPDQSVEPEIIPEQPLISLTLNDNSEYEIFQKDVDEWGELYPSVDVMQELRNMKGWCKEHKANRKTRRGVRIFINSWLSKEQNRGGKRTMSGVEAFINGRK